MRNRRGPASSSNWVVWPPFPPSEIKRDYDKQKKTGCPVFWTSIGWLWIPILTYHTAGATGISRGRGARDHWDDADGDALPLACCRCGYSLTRSRPLQPIGY